MGRRANNLINNETIYKLKEQGLSYKEIRNYFLKIGIDISEKTIIERCAIIYAQKGKKIGSEDFPLETIDAYIGVKYYGAEIGKTTTRRSTYYAAILAWAGICYNYKSDGNALGGYIQIK